MNFKEDARKEFESKVIYVGAFVVDTLPKCEKTSSEELPNKNPEGTNHVTLFYFGNISEISESLFDDILDLPEHFEVFATGYGYDKCNQGICVDSNEFDFKDTHKYGNTKVVPHITYSWDKENGGTPVKTGFLHFKPDFELYGEKITVKVMAFLNSKELVPIKYYKDRAVGKIPEMSAKEYKNILNNR